MTPVIMIKIRYLLSVDDNLLRDNDMWKQLCVCVCVYISSCVYMSMCMYISSFSAQSMSVETFTQKDLEAMFCKCRDIKGPDIDFC